MADGPQAPVTLAYEQLVDLWPDAVVVFDERDRRFVYANGAAERLVGYRRDEILAFRAGDFSHPDDAREIPALLKQAQRTGSVRRSWRVCHKDGQLIDTEMTLTPQIIDGRRLAHGVLRQMPTAPLPSGAPGTGSTEADSTLEAEAPLVRDADRLDVLEQTGLAVVMLDQDGIITYWNAGAAELYGWPSAEVFGRQVLDLAVNDEAKSDVEGLMSPQAGRDEWVTQLTIRRHDGDSFQAMVTCSTIRNDDGALTGFLFVSAAVEPAVRTATPRMRRARVQCAACGREVAGTMRRKYCSEKCRQWAYYHRHLDAQRARSRQRHERQRTGAETDASANANGDADASTADADASTADADASTAD
jgi:PAS domain S-box-containing protein